MSGSLERVLWAYIVLITGASVAARRSNLFPRGIYRRRRLDDYHPLGRCIAISQALEFGARPPRSAKQRSPQRETLYSPPSISVGREAIHDQIVDAVHVRSVDVINRRRQGSSGLPLQFGRSVR